MGPLALAQGASLQQAARQGQFYEPKNLKEKKRMPRKIDADECISCGACAEVCPEDAISEGEDAYVIDPEKCTDCGTCEPECPVEAISAE